MTLLIKNSKLKIQKLQVDPSVLVDSALAFDF